MNMDPQFMMFAQQLWQQMNGQNQNNNQQHPNMNGQNFNQQQQQPNNNFYADGCRWCGEPAGECTHCFACGELHATVHEAIRCRECGCNPPDDDLD